MRIGERVLEVGGDDGVSQIRRQVVEPVATRRNVLGLALDRGARHHAERVEGHGGTIAVGIHEQRGLQYAIVLAMFRERLGGINVALAHGGAVAEVVLGLLQQQVVRVIAEERLAAERIARAEREEKMLQRVGQFRCRPPGIEHLSGGDPPQGVALAVNVMSLAREQGIGDARAIGLAHQTRREGQLVAFKGKGPRFQLTGRQRAGQVVVAVQRAHLFDQTFLQGARGGALLILEVRRGGSGVQHFLEGEADLAGL